MTGLALAPICTFFAAHYYFFWKLKKLGQAIALEPDHIYFRFLEGQSEQMFLIFLICSFVAILLVFILGLMLSHKIAGPIHRLKMYMTDMSQGQELGDLSFRKGDYFLELPPIVNQFVKAVRKK
jgi:signal transduction histidine kinase